MVVEGSIAIQLSSNETLLNVCCPQGEANRLLKQTSLEPPNCIQR